MTEKRGIPCPACGRGKLYTKDVRAVVGGIRRYRQCKCGHRVMTIEKVVEHGSKNP